MKEQARNWKEVNMEKKLKFHENVPYDLDFCDSNLLLFCGHYHSPFILEAKD